jgi:hypothetical protein
MKHLDSVAFRIRFTRALKTCRSKRRKRVLGLSWTYSYFRFNNWNIICQYVASTVWHFTNSNHRSRVRLGVCCGNLQNNTAGSEPCCISLQNYTVGSEPAYRTTCWLVVAAYRTSLLAQSHVVAAYRTTWWLRVMLLQPTELHAGLLWQPTELHCWLRAMLWSLQNCTAG